ncbi:MAG: sulfotransferase domain-containing protein [Bacteroidota bacterium]
MKVSNTIFHITHWKAGSQWIHRILRELFPKNIVSPKVYEKQFLEEPLLDGYIYPTVYVTREQFFSVSLPSNYKKFIIIRDLRDTLVSGYFSIRYSHALVDETLRIWREQLECLSTEDGLLLLMDEWLPESAQIQKSWINTNEVLIRYEDLLNKDNKILFDVLINKCSLSISPERLTAVIAKNRFKQVANGRPPGQEDIFSHQRKGVSGDWKNYFTPLVIKEFMASYGDLLSQAGYEE